MLSDQHLAIVPPSARHTPLRRNEAPHPYGVPPPPLASTRADRRTDDRPPPHRARLLQNARNCSPHNVPTVGSLGGRSPVLSTLRGTYIPVALTEIEPVPTALAVRA